MTVVDSEEEKPKAFPIPKTIWWREDQNDLLLKAKAATGRPITDIIREGSIAYARRLVSDAKRAKRDQ
jgi:hypothetical protein